MRIDLDDIMSHSGSGYGNSDGDKNDTLWGVDRGDGWGDGNSAGFGDGVCSGGDGDGGSWVVLLNNFYKEVF
jgi:hypothetical protein